MIEQWCVCVCQGADGVEYLLIPVDNGTLTDFLERSDTDWLLWIRLIMYIKL